jgi:AraC-like DNA-binding protein
MWERSSQNQKIDNLNEAHKDVVTGIGLSLVKELVSFMEETLSLTSEIGKGLPSDQTGNELLIMMPIEIGRAMPADEATVGGNELLLKVRNRIAIQVKLGDKIILELLKESPNVEILSADEKFLVKVKETIIKCINDEQLSVESLAEEIGLSRSQLLRKITALTGVSVNELIRTIRLQKAAQLLGQNWAPVSQVAYEVGFSNLSYFSKVFKDQYGVLPSEYGTKAH